MSNPIETSPTPVSEFQHFVGAPPGTQDAKAECREWERVCAGLIAERERLRAELAMAQADRDANFRAWLRLECANYVCPYSKAELLSFVGQRPTIHELIQELEHAREK